MSFEGNTLQDKRVFSASFIIFGFIMKVVAELVHEICGHSFFVLLFGGKITHVYISLLWPYELSYIKWALPETVTSAQKVWVYGGGILVRLCLSLLVQVFLFVKRKVKGRCALILFWLAFWTFISSTGYLIIGGLRPFGDVFKLIKLGVLTSLSSLILGLIIFITGFVALSWILRRILTEVLSLKNAYLGVSLFWLILPLLAVIMLASPERSLQAAYLPLMFIPAVLSLAIEYFLVLSKQDTYASPDNVTEKQGCD